MATRRLQILDDDDSDPMLSSINLVDVFLVAMVILMIAQLNHPLWSVSDDDVTVIRDAGKPSMEILVKRGEKLTRFESTGASSQGDGIMAGTAYRMKDGSMVYVPENNPSQSGRQKP